MGAVLPGCGCGDVCMPPDVGPKGGSTCPTICCGGSGEGRGGIFLFAQLMFYSPQPL